MRSITILLLIASVCAVGSAAQVFNPTRQQAADPYQPVNSDLLPGNPLPENTCCCEGYFETYPELHCRLILHPGNHVILFIYDVRRKQITRTTILEPDKTVGDLINLWGLP